ncbi:hypothetical protein LTR10_007954 [Elasticomyces elasticus]|nr:hypothetical protein LTR10_007954 [Elasticomyces elasticus]KAK4970953.1 hypothetical protein LTR42_007930 [Elasticomyces elasticus]
MATKTLTPVGNARASQRCHLLELPPELRLLIYEFLYASDYKHNIVVDGALVVFTLAKPIFGRIFQHFAALLRTCTLIHNEAEPILYEATAFDMYIQSELLSVERSRKGKLHTCKFFGHIMNIRKLKIRVPDVDNGVDNAVRCIAGLARALPSNKQYRLTNIEMWYGSPTWERKDGIVKALMGLNCKPGVKFLFIEGNREVRLAYCVSAVVKQEFVRKLGIQEEQETE